MGYSECIIRYMVCVCKTETKHAIIERNLNKNKVKNRIKLLSKYLFKVRSM